MLKRSRAPSPSPTRAIPSSPPPLDGIPHLPFSKRRRTVGPVIDSSERRDGTAEDDGEVDDDLGWESDATNISSADGKLYEHVNHLLHCLHTEHQYRSRTAQLQSGSSFRHPSSHIPDPCMFILPGDLSPPRQSSTSSPAMHSRDSQTCPTPSLIPHQIEEVATGCSDSLRDMTQFIPKKTEVGREDERIRVTQRYEDTNRLLGSLVLSRRHTLRSPSADSD